MKPVSLKKFRGSRIKNIGDYLRTLRSKKKDLLTKADSVQGVIEDVQSRCQHTFRLDQSPPKLDKSKIRGIFLGGTRDSDYNDPIWLHVKCSACDTEKDVSVKTTCPHCLSEVKRGEGKDDMRPRPECVDGEDSRDYDSRIYYCTNEKCGLKYFIDEYNR